MTMNTDDFRDHGPERHAPVRRTRPASERHVALVDARFWNWLQDEDQAGDGAAGSVHAAQDELQRVVQHQGSRLVRTLWFTDQDFDGAVPGLQVRRVPSNAQDRGVTMLRAMAQDLLALAEHGSVDRVLVVSDDDRLLLAVDEAQRRGLQVDMLVDGESQDLKALREEDPNWASLLLSADRLVVLGGGETTSRAPRQRNTAMMGESRPRREAPSAEASGIIEDEILTWWDDETPDQRDHWRQEIQAARGIPQELDRQLLLRISRRLGQPLSPAEKSMMRQQVRQQIAGEGGGGAVAATTTPTDA